VTGAPAEEHKNARLFGSHCLAGFVDIVAAHDNPRQTHAESTEATGKHGLTTIELQVAHGWDPCWARMAKWRTLVKGFKEVLPAM
jgi:hypothetical protein